jgi:AcrR family transcriptional regulator
MDDNQKIPSKIGRPIKMEGEKSTKTKIFDTAIDLFSDRGYERTSVREIASALGITEGAIYRHYKSKEAILEEIFAFAEIQIFTPLPIEQTLGLAKEQSIFRGLLEPLPDTILAQPIIVKIMRIMFHELNYNEKIRQNYQTNYIAKADEHIEALFKKCMELGTIIYCDVKSLTNIFNSYRSTWAMHNFVLKHETEVDRDKLKKELN